MKRSKIRQTFSWVIGLLVFGLFYFLLKELISFVGLFEYFYIQDIHNEQSFEAGSLTILGMFLVLIEVLVAFRIGTFIYNGNLSDGIGELGENTNLILYVIVLYAGGYSLIGTALWELFEEQIQIGGWAEFFSFFMFFLTIPAWMLGYNFFIQKEYSTELLKKEVNRFVKLVSDDRDHFLEKKDGFFFLGFDNGSDLKIWKFSLNQNMDEKTLANEFLQKTGNGTGQFEFFKWLEDRDIILKEHNWY